MSDTSQDAIEAILCSQGSIYADGSLMAMYCPECLNYKGKCKFLMKRKKQEYGKHFIETDFFK